MFRHHSLNGLSHPTFPARSENTLYLYVALSHWRPSYDPFLCGFIDEAPCPFHKQAAIEALQTHNAFTQAGPDLCVSFDSADLKALWRRLRQVRADEDWARYPKALWSHWPAPSMSDRVDIIWWRWERRTLHRAFRILRSLSRTAHIKRELIASSCRPSRLWQI